MAYFSYKKMTGDLSEMKELASRICRDYLHGAWKFVNAQNICVKHISGGLSNLLYHISLPESLLTNEKTQGEPKQVLIRIYGSSHGERAIESLITDSVIFTLLSERGLGPKLHGIFPGGRIEEYINARPLLTRELADDRLSTLIAQKMAAIHAMEVPLQKDPSWLWETTARWLKTVNKRLSGPGPDCMKTMLDADLNGEYQWLKQRMEEVGSPVVFCHNDMQEGNILLHQDEAENNNAEPRLILIDFEYCSYNYRAFDLANHFMEWTYNYTAKDHPYFSEHPEDYPTVDRRLSFIKVYLDELGLKEDPKILLEEVEWFNLACNFFWCLWAVANAESQIPFGYWEFGAAKFDNYLKIKKELNHTPAIKRKVNSKD